MIEIQVDETKYGYVYRITNLINGKTYIGQHKIIKGEKWLSYMGSGRIIRHAIHKHGVGNFSKELLLYAETKEELAVLEQKMIQEEMLNDKAEYNIQGGNEALAVRLKELDFTDKQLLSWYFDDCMSYEAISYKLNCSLSAIHQYMKKFKETDSRFKDINQSNNINRYNYDVEVLKKHLTKSLEKRKCENCSKHISHSNYETHLEACLSDDYFDGFRKHKCATADCDILIYKKNTYCKKHYLENGFKGVATPDTVKKGGIIASHNRWHVARGKVSEKCELCQESFKA